MKFYEYIKQRDRVRSDKRQKQYFMAVPSHYFGGN